MQWWAYSEGMFHGGVLKGDVLGREYSWGHRGVLRRRTLRVGVYRVPVRYELNGYEFRGGCTKRERLRYLCRICRTIK